MTKLLDRSDLNSEKLKEGSLNNSVLNNNTVVFRANYMTFVDSLWSININTGLPSLIKLVDTETRIPQGIGKFTKLSGDYGEGTLTISGDKVFFGGLGNNQSGIYSIPTNGGSISMIVNQSTQKPSEKAGTFMGVWNGYNEDFKVDLNQTFFSTSNDGFYDSYAVDLSDGIISRIYGSLSGGQLCMPSLPANINFSPVNPDISNGFTAFRLYEEKWGFLSVSRKISIAVAPFSEIKKYSTPCSKPPGINIASGNDVVPGTEASPRTFADGDFKVSFGAPQIDNGTVVFSGAAKPISLPGIKNTDQDLQGIYISTTGSDRKIRKLVDTNTPVPGGAGNFKSFAFRVGTHDSVYSISGNKVVFYGEDAKSKPGLYLISTTGDALTKIIAEGDTVLDETVTSLFINENSLDGNHLVFEALGGIYLATLDGNGGGTSSSNIPALGQTESVDQVQSNQPFSYTVSFTNNAPSVATSVKLTDKLSKKAKLVSAVTSLGKKCKGKAPVMCNFGTVASGANVTATITVTRKTPGKVTNSAVITYKMVKAGTKKKKSYRLTSSESTTVN